MSEELGGAVLRELAEPKSFEKLLKRQVGERGSFWGSEGGWGSLSWRSVEFFFWKVSWGDTCMV